MVLFCISEFLIGALCLLCLGLYAINFGLLGLFWWASARGQRFAGMAKGARLLFSFGGIIIKGDVTAIRGALALGILLVFSAILPLVVYRFELARSSHSPRADLNDQYLSAWRNAPVVELKVDLSRGSAGDYVKGEIPAPIQIVEFADFECPGCRVAYSKLTDILAKYQGQYSLVFKNYPLDSECNPAIKGDFHKAACFAAHLTRCAGEQGRFWEAIEVAFTDPALESDELSSDDMRSALFDSVTRSLSLDAEALKECVDSRRHQAKIQDDVREGDRLGLTSTPSFWINGKKLERPTPEAFELVFRDILAKAGSR